MSGVSAERTHDRAVLRLTVDRPKGNIFSGGVMQTLLDEMQAAQLDKSLKLIVLQAAGPHFSFGASVEEHTAEHVADMLPVLRELVLEIAGSEVPVAALVQGMCLGGAFEIVGACHFVFAALDARMGLPEIRLGVFPPAAAALLQRKCGQAIADSLLLSGEEWDAGRLHTVGFVHQVLPADSLRQGFDAWFEKTLGQFSAASLREATRASRAGFVADLADELEAGENQYLDSLMKLADANEGIQAFLERREPQWRNA
ncbi:MAG: enoyl-CoA hydratase/isomerase family protein [Planctomycetes bacterium]|nr:enoyl-CoA hydratase/isomerase family protein [Planctomycetota bacterium]